MKSESSGALSETDVLNSYFTSFTSVAQDGHNLSLQLGLSIELSI